MGRRIEKWLHGNISSQDSLIYVGNCLSVYRVRPRDPEYDARSDEDFDDVKLELDEDMLKRAMQSRVGGKSFDNVSDVKECIDGKTSHEDNSKTAMDLAKKIWPEKDVRHCQESVSSEYDSKSVDGILAAARASQRRDKRGGQVLENADKAPALSVAYSATVEEVRAWCKEIGKRSKRKTNIKHITA